MMVYLLLFLLNISRVICFSMKYDSNFKNNFITLHLRTRGLFRSNSFNDNQIKTNKGIFLLFSFFFFGGGGGGGGGGVLVDNEMTILG